MKAFKRVIGLLLVLTIAVGLFAACGSKGNAGATSGADGAKLEGDPVKIGLSASLTGNVASGGLRMEQAITMLTEEVNADGGINGRPLELIVVDDQSTPTGAVNAVNKLIGDGVVAIVGPT